MCWYPKRRGQLNSKAIHRIALTYAYMEDIKFVFA